MAGQLSGRVAIIAGASRGIGMGIAVELGAAGAHVYALGRTLHAGEGARGGSLDETIAQIEALGGQGTAIACDATDDAALADVFARVDREQGRLDVLVNSVFLPQRLAPFIGKRFWETPPEHWDDIVEVGVRSAYIASRRAAPPMIATAAKHGTTPAIVNVTGRAAVRYRYNVIYSVGKAAGERLTRDMALDLKEHGVATFSIWPNGHAADPAKPETPRYNGRAVVALLGEADLMARSGQHFWSAEIGAQYGFTDEHGHSHPIGDLADEYSLDEA